MKFDSLSHLSPLKQTLKIASLPALPPEPSPLPYLNLFYNALASHGILNVCEFHPSVSWLKKNQRKIDAIHIHWPEKIWMNENGSFQQIFNNFRGYYAIRRITRRYRAYLGLLVLNNILRFAKPRKIKVVWTIHELAPHTSSGRVDRLVYKRLSKGSDLIIVHSRDAEKSFISTYGPNEKIVLMRHGNFKDAYPPPRAKHIVMEELNFNKKLPVIALLGALRKYKGIDLALEVVGFLEQEVNFLIAGEPLNDFPLTETIRKVEKLNNVKLVPKSLTTQEFADYSGVCDAFLLPYKNITTSGIMHAAFTFNSGIIASKLPYFEEVLREHPGCGKIAENYTSEDFVQAIKSYLEIPIEKRTCAAQIFTEQTQWQDVVIPVIEKIRSWQW